jgi:glutamate--cysteine ligase
VSVPQEGFGDELIKDPQQLIDFIASGCKPYSEWSFGVENERFCYDLDTKRPLPYRGDNGGASISAILEMMKNCFGYIGIYEDGYIIGLRRGNIGISLEPGGQLELAGAPLRSIAETEKELLAYRQELLHLSRTLNVGFLNLGATPDWSLADVPCMPKGRYRIMKNYMPKTGTSGLDMMFRTCTAQVNLDYSSEEDMVEKMRLGLKIQPISTALFANSPLLGDGKPSGYVSRRADIWTRVDSDRTGFLPFVFKDGFGFKQWVEYALDVPMYFVCRGGKYIDVAGHSFRNFLHGKLDALPGELPMMSDWADHLTTLFPEARVKRFIEMRGADCCMDSMICSLPAFWVGLLYDATARAETQAIVGDWQIEECNDLRSQVTVQGLKTRIRGDAILEITRELLKIAKRGLENRARIDEGAGSNDARFLEPLERIVDTGKTSAEEIVSRYYDSWKQDIAHVYDDYGLSYRNCNDGESMPSLEAIADGCELFGDASRLRSK